MNDGPIVTLYEWQAFAFAPPSTFLIGLDLSGKYGGNWYVMDIGAAVNDSDTSRFRRGLMWDGFLAVCRELKIDSQIPRHVFEMVSEE